MREETWSKGTLLGVTDDGKPMPVPRGAALSTLITDTDKAGTVAELKTIVKKILSLLACFAMVLLMGCGMFGDSRLYTGILNLCAKCHADNLTAPAGMDNLKSVPGAEGPGGNGAKCKFTMDHWTRNGGTARE